MENSYKVVTIGQAITKNLIDNYGHRDKIFTYYNGYDESDYLNIRNINYKCNENSFIHLGSIKNSKNREIDLLIEAIKFVSNPKTKSQKVTFTFLGDLTKEEIAKINNCGLNNYIKVRKPRSKKLALEEAAKYKFSLFYGVPEQKSYISSKLFDYIRLRKPILGICIGNESEEILSKVKNCVVTGFDADLISKKIEEIIKRPYILNNEYSNYDRLNSLIGIEKLLN